jgi:hypothetical protein
MAEVTNELIFGVLKQMQEDLSQVKFDVRELKHRLTSVEEGISSLNRRMEAWKIAWIGSSAVLDWLIASHKIRQIELVQTNVLCSEGCKIRCSLKSFSTADIGLVSHLRPENDHHADD